MAAFQAMRALKDEEKYLNELKNKLMDQLNRLKIEELTLLAKIREEKVRKTTTGSKEEASVSNLEKVDDENINSRKLDLDVKQFSSNVHGSGPGIIMEVEEEDEDTEENESDDPNSRKVTADQLDYFSY